jgi:CBS domain containing-hemolysin-like protein
MLFGEACNYNKIVVINLTFKIKNKEAHRGHETTTSHDQGVMKSQERKILKNIFKIFTNTS